MSNGPPRSCNRYCPSPLLDAAVPDQDKQPLQLPRTEPRANEQRAASGSPAWGTEKGRSGSVQAMVSQACRGHPLTLGPGSSQPREKGLHGGEKGNGGGRRGEGEKAPSAGADVCRRAEGGCESAADERGGRHTSSQARSDDRRPKRSAPRTRHPARHGLRASQGLRQQPRAKGVLPDGPHPLVPQRMASCALQHASADGARRQACIETRSERPVLTSARAQCQRGSAEAERRARRSVQLTRKPGRRTRTAPDSDASPFRASWHALGRSKGESLSLSEYLCLSLSCRRTPRKGSTGARYS